MIKSYLGWRRKNAKKNATTTRFILLSIFPFYLSFRPLAAPPPLGRHPHNCIHTKKGVKKHHVNVVSIATEI